MGTSAGTQDVCFSFHFLLLCAHSWDYCDKNPNSKEPKGSDERNTQRKTRKEKKGGASGEEYKNDEISKLKATVDAHKKLIAIQEVQKKAEE